MCMERDQSFILYAAVEPDNATDKALHWSSNNSYVATVENGVVTTHNSGTATIAATPRDGGNVIATCTVRVTDDRLVTSVEIDDPPTTMIVGDTQVLQASVYPNNATHKSVVWHSEDETIATVNPDTGLLTAQGEGITWIYATAKDGSGSYGIFTLEVKKPSVTIMKDGDYHKVVFNETGKVWRCIERDRVFDPEPHSVISHRSNYNYFEVYNEDHDGIGGVKEYSDDEIKMLYAIDPHGVADYVKRYTEHLSESYPINQRIRKILEFKDGYFRLLFNRDPKYFCRTGGGEWQETEVTEDSDLREVFSESESLFGLHALHDDYVLRDNLNVAVSIIKAVAIFATKNEKIVDFIDKLADGIKCSILLICGAEDVFFEEIGPYLLGFVGDSFEEDLPEKFKAGPVSAINNTIDKLLRCVDVVMAMRDLAESMASTPESFKQAFYNYTYDFPYDVYVQLANGQQYAIKDIQEAMDTV